MQSIKINSYVGKDGMLHLDIPVDVQETELEVTVTVKPVQKTIDGLSEDEVNKLEWHDFINVTYGCLADDPIIRYPQGEYEEREAIE
jgi:myosin-crossreactive antigen